jgi:hypothetical protein
MDRGFTLREAPSSVTTLALDIGEMREVINAVSPGDESVSVQCCASLTILSLHRGTADRFRRYSNGPATVRNLRIFIQNKTESGSLTQPAYTEGGRMILWIFSIAGVIVGVFAVGKSISDSEALLLIGISLIGVAIRLRRGKGMRD